MSPHRSGKSSAPRTSLLPVPRSKPHTAIRAHREGLWAFNGHMIQITHCYSKALLSVTAFYPLDDPKKKKLRIKGSVKAGSGEVLG